MVRRADRTEGPVRLVVGLLAQAPPQACVQRGLSARHRVDVEHLTGFAECADPCGEPGFE